MLLHHYVVRVKFHQCALDTCFGYKILISSAQTQKYEKIQKLLLKRQKIYANFIV